MWGSRRRGHYDHIPGLEGLSDQRQRELYQQARRETGWSWQLALLMLGWFACFWATWRIDDVLYGSPLNPGIPLVLIRAVLIGGLVYAWMPLWRWYELNVVAPRIWRRLPGICNGCGYDLTGNQSGRCPECGLEVGAEAGPQKAARWRPFVRLRNPFRFTDLIVLIVVVWLVVSAAMLIAALQ